MLLPECMRVARRKELQDERERKVETIRRTSRQVIWGKGVVRREQEQRRFWPPFRKPTSYLMRRSSGFTV